MKLLFVSILLTLSCKICSAQSDYLDYNGKDLNTFLNINVRPVPALMENCLMPFTYIKFKVTDNNTIDSLIITNTSLPDVTQEITRVMALTNGHWNVERTKDKWMIVPLIFYTEFNSNPRGKKCDFKKILADQDKEMNYRNKEINAVYFPIVKINAHWNN
ncbi:hypothetical protein [Mucilaginibacter phyllosphaerae]